jgi:hypothetical protein
MAAPVDAAAEQFAPRHETAWLYGEPGLAPAVFRALPPGFQAGKIAIES